ncbi:hypothetical protein CTEN210_18150 [Chaetoceros tenuissimus]|uniref:SWIM-type domain-containing protein n=1 Tax=Chaetoceros tenuissimus TaxID=426638 RepID=A0AAD3DC06_9STRA|nr:hypothetical protein CTEN210_18150 [Chaetoceros tenuissimus]
MNPTCLETILAVTIDANTTATIVMMLHRFLVFHESCTLENKQRFPKFVCNWMYSWTKSTCDSSAEYETSKELLLSWLVSDEVITHICPIEVSRMIITWMQTSVFPHVADYAFYTRRTDENMENSTCCAIEGTHNALKHNENAVKRTDTLPIYVKKAVDYDLMRLKKVQTMAAERKEKTNLYGYEWANHLCNKGSLLTYNIIQWSEHYVSQFSGCVDGLPEFVVLCDEQTDEDSHILNENTLEAKGKTVANESDHVHEKSYSIPRSYPKYRHSWKVRLVKQNGEFSLVCNCMLLRRVGIPCHHIHTVMKYHLNDWFFGVDWFDYKVEWWRITYTLCYKPPENFTEDEKILFEKLLHLADNDSRLGIQLRPKNSSSVESSIMKHEWDCNKKFGMCVVNGDSLEPLDVVTQGAKSRLKNWKFGKDDDEVPNKMLESRVIDYSEEASNIEVKKVVQSSLTQQRCKKDVLDLVYDICEKVEFAEHPEYFDKLRKSLDRLHTESIDIAMKGKLPVETNVIKTFAGATRHGQQHTQTKRVHSFHTKSEKAKKSKGKRKTNTSPRRGKKVFNITSP